MLPSVGIVGLPFGIGDDVLLLVDGVVLVAVEVVCVECSLRNSVHVPMKLEDF